MKTRINADEKTVSIRELWWYFLSKWRGVLALIILLAALLGLFGCYQAVNENKENAELRKQLEYTDEQILSGLTQNEKKQVTDAIEIYERYMRLSEEITGNYIMKLNPDSVYKVGFQYFIDTNYIVDFNGTAEENYAADIIEMYRSMVDSETVRDSVMGLEIPGLEKKDISYLIVTSSTGHMLKIDIYGKPDDCVKIADIIKAYLADGYTTVSKAIGKHDITLVNEDCVETFRDTFRTFQTNKKNDAKTLSASLTTATSVFNEEQQEAYDVLKAKSDEENDRLSLGDVSLLNKKYVVLGAAVGLVLAAIIIIIKFGFSRKLMSLRDVEKVYNVPLIGSVAVTSKSSLDKLIRNKRFDIRKKTDKEEQIKYIAQAIICKCKGISELLMCTCSNNDKEVSAVREEVACLLEKNGISVKYADSVVDNAESLSAIASIGNVVFVEKMDKIECIDLTDEINICDRLDIEIAGIVVII